MAGRVARHRGLSKREAAAEVIRRAAKSDDDCGASLRFIDAADRSDVVSQEWIMAEPDANIVRHRSLCG